MLQVTREMRELINVGAPVDAIRDCAQKNGLESLAQHAIQLAENGITSLDEILRVAVFDS